jgi:hypothetical protein
VIYLTQGACGSLPARDGLWTYSCPHRQQAGSHNHHCIPKDQNIPKDCFQTAKKKRRLRGA